MKGGTDRVAVKGLARMLTFSLTLVSLVSSAFALEITDKQHIRNGDFEMGATAWGKGGGILTGITDGGNPGKAFRISPTSETNHIAFLLQEIHCPEQITSASFDYDYIIGATNTGATFGLFKVCIAKQLDIFSNPGNELVTLHHIDNPAAIPTGWSRHSHTFSAANIESIRQALDSGERIFVLVVLYAVYVDAIVDNVSLALSGNMQTDFPNHPIAYLKKKEGAIGRNQIYKTSSFGAEEKIFEHNDTLSNIYDIQWSPQGDKIAFTSTKDSTASRYSSDIFVINPDGDGLKRITNAPGPESNAAFPMGTVTGTIVNKTGSNYIVAVYVQGASMMTSVSVGPSGSASDSATFTIENVADLGPGVSQFIGLYGTSASGSGRETSIVSADVIAGQTVQVGEVSYFGYTSGYAATDISWKSDASKIGYVLDGLLMQIDTVVPFSVEKKLLDLILVADAVAWSPTDDALLFSQMFPGEKTGIYLAQAGDANEGAKIVSRISYTGTPQAPCWLPDKSGFVFTMTNTGTDTPGPEFTPFKLTADYGTDIFLYKFSTGKYTNLTDFYNEHAAKPRLSADGRYVVFERKSSDYGKYDIWIMKIPGGGERRRMWQITSDGASSEPDWAKNSAPNNAGRYIMVY